MLQTSLDQKRSGKTKTKPMLYTPRIHVQTCVHVKGDAQLNGFETTLTQRICATIWQSTTARGKSIEHSTLHIVLLLLSVQDLCEIRCSKSVFRFIQATFSCTTKQRAHENVPDKPDAPDKLFGRCTHLQSPGRFYGANTWWSCHHARTSSRVVSSPQCTKAEYIAGRIILL